MCHPVDHFEKYSTSTSTFGSHNFQTRLRITRLFLALALAALATASESPTHSHVPLSPSSSSSFPPKRRREVGKWGTNERTGQQFQSEPPFQRREGERERERERATKANADKQTSERVVGRRGKEGRKAASSVFLELS